MSVSSFSAAPVHSAIPATAVSACRVAECGSGPKPEAVEHSGTALRSVTLWEVREVPIDISGPDPNHLFPREKITTDVCSITGGHSK
jgi:hypothetical protein